MRKVYILFISLFVMSSLFGQVPTNGLVAHYPFSSNALDASGNNLHGTVNGATLTTDRFGNQNEAYHFDGTTNITIPNFTMPAKEVTISLWAKTDTLKKQMVFKQLSDDINRVAGSIHYKTTGTTYPGSINTYWDFGSSTDGRIYDSVESTLKVWEHYVFIASNKNGYMKVFLNNEEVILDNTAISLTDSVFTLAIGGTDLTTIVGGLYYIGSIDDFRVYDRVLSVGEIQELYNEEIVSNLTEHKEVYNFEIFPNPASEELNVISRNSTLFKVKIISITGSTIFESGLCYEKNSINLKDKSIKGLHIIQILDSDNQILESKKLIVN